jgi:hypothetical protein
MLIAPTQSATPTPRQVNRRIYFHTIIAASKALRSESVMRHIRHLSLESLVKMDHFQKEPPLATFDDSSSGPFADFG